MSILYYEQHAVQPQLFEFQLSKPFNYPNTCLPYIHVNKRICKQVSLIIQTLNYFLPGSSLFSRSRLHYSNTGLHSSMTTTWPRWMVSYLDSPVLHLLKESQHSLWEMLHYRVARTAQEPQQVEANGCCVDVRRVVDADGGHHTSTKKNCVGEYCKTEVKRERCKQKMNCTHLERARRTG